MQSNDRYNVHQGGIDLVRSFWPFCPTLPNYCNKVYKVLPGFRALGPPTAKSALNQGSAIFPRYDLFYFEL